MVGRCWEGWLLRDFQPHKMGHNLSRNVSYMIIYLGIYALGIWLIMTHKFINDWLWLLSKFQPKNWRDVIDSYSLEGGLFVVVVVYPAIYRVNVCHFFCCFFWEGSPPKQNDEWCAHFNYSGPQNSPNQTGFDPAGETNPGGFQFGNRMFGRLVRAYGHDSFLMAAAASGQSPRSS